MFASPKFDINELPDAFTVKTEPGTLRVFAELPATQKARAILLALEEVAIAYEDSSISGAAEQAESFRSFQKTLLAYTLSKTEFVRYLSAALDVSIESARETRGDPAKIAALTSAFHSLSKALANVEKDDIEREYIHLSIRIGGPRLLIRTAALVMSSIVKTTIAGIKAAIAKAKLEELKTSGLPEKVTDEFKIFGYGKSGIPALRFQRKSPPFPCTEEALQQRQSAD
jgi:hypothetical protein